MLFSDARVSALVRDNFAVAWESVRPVPTVEIDFGNGKKIKRTVNGNIATYLCAPDGRVVDIIPGLNTPEAFHKDLKSALNLYWASQNAFEATVLDYHQSNLKTPTTYEWVRNDKGKAMIERLMKCSLDKKLELAEKKMLREPGFRRPDSGKFEVESKVKALTAEETAILEADTELNRKERKPVIHKILSEKIVRPAEITKRVYKDALHCDLDDPYLGLISGAFGGGAYEGR